MAHSGKAMAKRFEQEMHATGRDFLGIADEANARIYKARKVLNDQTFRELLRHSPAARAASGAMSHNDAQLLDAARANGDTRHNILHPEAPSEIARLRSSLHFYTAYELRQP